MRKRYARTLLWAIKKNILRGSVIHSGKWWAYTGIERVRGMQYVHRTVNHSMVHGPNHRCDHEPHWKHLAKVEGEARATLRYAPRDAKFVPVRIYVAPAVRAAERHRFPKPCVTRARSLQGRRLSKERKNWAQVSKSCNEVHSLKEMKLTEIHWKHRKIWILLCRCFSILDAFHVSLLTLSLSICFALCRFSYFDVIFNLRIPIATTAIITG